jgi:hypothetical protein
VIRKRRMNKDKRAEFEAAVDAYMHAMGDFVTTLGQAMAPQQRMDDIARRAAGALAGTLALAPISGRQSGAC